MIKQEKTGSVYNIAKEVRQRGRSTWERTGERERDEEGERGKENEKRKGGRKGRGRRKWSG